MFCFDFCGFVFVGRFGCWLGGFVVCLDCFDLIWCFVILLLICAVWLLLWCLLLIGLFVLGWVWVLVGMICVFWYDWLGLI